jgi:hypothetical protein
MAPVVVIIVKLLQKYIFSVKFPNILPKMMYFAAIYYEKVTNYHVMTKNNGGYNLRGAFSCPLLK